jgi:hypothetical protein
LPQGFPKKIEFQLLLAHLALQLRDTLPGRAEIVGWLRSKIGGRCLPGRPPSLKPKTRRAQLPVPILPSIQKCPLDLQLYGEIADGFSSQHAFDDLKLRLRTE